MARAAVAVAAAAGVRWLEVAPVVAVERLGVRPSLLAIRARSSADQLWRTISAIAIAKGNSDVIWIGYQNGDVYFTTNGTELSSAL